MVKNKMLTQHLQVRIRARIWANSTVSAPYRKSMWGTVSIGNMAPRHVGAKLIIQPFSSMSLQNYRLGGPRITGPADRISRVESRFYIIEVNHSAHPTDFVCQPTEYALLRTKVSMRSSPNELPNGPHVIENQLNMRLVYTANQIKGRQGPK